MKLITNHRETVRTKHMENDLPGHHRIGSPLPPHERKRLVQIEFDEQDWDVLNEVFGDPDTTAAAAEVIEEAPPEIKILAVQLMKLIKEDMKNEG